MTSTSSAGRATRGYRRQAVALRVLQLKLPQLGPPASGLSVREPPYPGSPFPANPPHPKYRPVELCLLHAYRPLKHLRPGRIPSITGPTIEARPRPPGVVSKRPYALAMRPSWSASVQTSRSPEWEGPFSQDGTQAGPQKGREPSKGAFRNKSSPPHHCYTRPGRTTIHHRFSKKLCMKRKTQAFRLKLFVPRQRHTFR